MFSAISNDQTILQNLTEDFLPILVESFLIDRVAGGAAKRTVLYYRNYLLAFNRHCEAQEISRIGQISPDTLRRYLIQMAENHNPGGVHAAFRALRAFFRWVEFEELMLPAWKNPIRKVKAPKVSLEPITPISLEDVATLVNYCERPDTLSKRNKAVFLCLLDTGARAQELCDLDIADVDFSTGGVIIRHGKGNKSRMVFVGRKTRRALRAYLRLRKDKCPALFVSRGDERLSYDGLRQLLERNTKKAGLQGNPNLHDFRRAFALNMLRNGADIFSLQRLMGHSDLSILRRYLAQTEQDIQKAHMLASPVDKSL